MIDVIVYNKIKDKERETERARRKKEMVKRYKVEFTEQENNYCYTGDWDDVIIAAESEEEAIELAKDWINENLVSYPYEIEDGKIIYQELESENTFIDVKRHKMEDKRKIELTYARCIIN